VDGASVDLQPVGGSDVGVGISVGIAVGAHVWPTLFGLDEGATVGGNDATPVGDVDGDTTGSRVGDKVGLGGIRLPQVTVNCTPTTRGTVGGGVGFGVEGGAGPPNPGASSLPVAPEPRQMFGYADVRE